MKTLKIVFFILVLVGCSKSEQPTPSIEENKNTTTNNVVINNYLLTIQETGDITVYHRIFLNGNEKATNSFNVSTNDVITGYSYTIASNGNTIGVTIYLEGIEEYSNVAYMSQNDTLYHSFTIN